MIVLIGTSNHYQIEVIYRKIKSRGYDVEIVDFLENSRITVINHAERIQILANGRDITAASVVYHDPKYLTLNFGNTQDWATKYTTQMGWRSANHSFFELLAGFKLNPLKVILPFSAKLKQLEIASKCGLLIPPFILSNDKRELIQFASLFDSVITKSVGMGAIPIIGEKLSQRVIMTSPVTLKMLNEADEIQPFPILLQLNLRKKFEYRIVVAGKKMKAFRINPSQHPIMHQDYRRGGYMVDYKLVDLDEVFAEKLLDLHKKLGLFSGSYDFIETASGEFYFLEVNPAGMWAYIDEKCGGQISDMFCDEIICIKKELEC